MFDGRDCASPSTLFLYLYSQRKTERTSSHGGRCCGGPGYGEMSTEGVRQINGSVVEINGYLCGHQHVERSTLLHTHTRHTDHAHEFSSSLVQVRKSVRRTQLHRGAVCECDDLPCSYQHMENSDNSKAEQHLVHSDCITTLLT
mmetsp:Transcript_18898/g.52537  ORF Transcript_18898/g.52537 Transcript_18898/m.52537 type:complete len:144 (-) Transcript_18898:11-442(-)